MRIFISIMFLFFSITSVAQVAKDSLQFSQSNFSEKSILNSFQKQLNTNNYSIVLKQFTMWDNFFFGVKENFNSTIVSTTTKNIKDEHYLSAIGMYLLSDKLSTGLHFNNTIYTDDRNIGLNKAGLYTGSFFVNYSPLEKIKISPYLGFEQNNQIGETDKGFVYGTEAGTNDYLMGDFEINSTIKFRNEDISPRKNTLRYINLDLQNKLEENFSNTITGYYIQQRRDFYFTADDATSKAFNISNNIQSRIETNYLLQDRINLLPTSSPFAFDILGRISLRNIDRRTRYVSTKTVATTNYDTNIEEFKLEFVSMLGYKVDNLDLSFRFSFSERDEKHQPVKYEGLSSIVFEDRKSLEEQKNNSSQLANLALSGTYNLTKKDIIVFSLFHRKLKYDTPSSDNYDDRDELLSIGSIFYQHTFNNMFNAFVNIEGSLNKMVYIFAERSANNNIKRTIKLLSGGKFTSGNLSSKNSAEVAANYTVFDYEDLNPNFKSYSFRQFAFRDSTVYSIYKNLDVNISGYLKLSEQGNFKWSNFTELPQRYLKEEYAEPRFSYKYFDFILSIGLRYYSLSTYSYTNGTIKNKISEYKSIGPISEINYILNEKVNLRVLGWYEFIKSEDNKNRQMANLDLRLIYNF